MTKINRRQFIQTSAIAGAGISMVPGINGLFASAPLTYGFGQLPTIPYGAVYFRKSNPPREDWERDYKRAAKDGMNCFRHWFIWSGIEVAPGKYDWDDYDRQLDLGAKYGIKTIIADILGPAPEWAFQEFPHARVEDAQGHKASSFYREACAVGGMPGVCFDNDDVLEVAENFFRALVSRYKDHPGLGGYDVWNEQNMNGSAGGCYCEGSTQKFRNWLKNKYGNLDKLGEAWNRYSYRDWNDIEIPAHDQFYGDAIDWVLFRIDNAYRLMKWRVDIIKEIDPDHPVTAHQNISKTLREVGPHTYNCFKAADLVEGFGFSGGSNHSEHTKNRWHHWITNDLTRSASKGKPFWAAEMPAGYSWQYKGRPMDDGRMTTAEDVRLFSMTSYAGGATGVFSPRWRPLLNGKHTGNFGFYAMDGSPTDRSEMAARVAKWSNDPEQKFLWEAKPVKGEVGIIVVPESQIQAYLLEDSTGPYYQAVNGAYQAFLFNNIQPDFVYDENISNEYDFLYLPYPIMLPEKVANSIKNYVRNGGILISEGCPAFWGDHGRAGTKQPNYGLDELFGVVQERYQLTPVLLRDMKFSTEGKKVSGGLYLQTYKATTGKIMGTYGENNEAVVIDNKYGNGKCRLIGTSPGYGYPESDYEETDREFFRDLFAWTGKKQHLRCSDSRLVARIHKGRDYFVVWTINSARENINAELELSESWNFQKYEVVESNGDINVSGNKIALDIPARDVAIIKFS